MRFQLKIINLGFSNKTLHMKFFKSVKLYSFVVLLITTTILFSCKKPKEKTIEVKTESSEDSPFFKLSLAQWSLHTEIESGKNGSF